VGTVKEKRRGRGDTNGRSETHSTSCGVVVLNEITKCGNLEGVGGEVQQERLCWGTGGIILFINSRAGRKNRHTPER